MYLNALVLLYFAQSLVKKLIIVTKTGTVSTICLSINISQLNYWNQTRRNQSRTQKCDSKGISNMSVAYLQIWQAPRTTASEIRVNFILMGNREATVQNNTEEGRSKIWLPLWCGRIIFIRYFNNTATEFSFTKFLWLENAADNQIYSETTAFEGAWSFVLFREEMGGRQSGRPITSDGKCFSLPHHNN